MKTSPKEAASPHGGSEVVALLEKRATIEQWIARLESQRGSVSEKVLGRVRADYERRLDETLDALGSHRSAIEEQLLSASDSLSAAEARRAESEEQLEEGRLRNVIGELTDEEWAGERVVLEDAVAAAATNESELQREVARLTQLMSQLNENEGSSRVDEVPQEPGEQTLSAPPAETELGIFSAAAAILDQATATPVSDSAGEDPFLASLDRVLSESAEPEDQPAPAIAFVDDEPQEDTAPKPGLKCGECGYTNDLSAWFCGVCGADVG